MSSYENLTCLEDPERICTISSLWYKGFVRAVPSRLGFLLQSTVLFSSFGRRARWNLNSLRLAVGQPFLSFQFEFQIPGGDAGPAGMRSGRGVAGRYMRLRKCVTIWSGSLAHAHPRSKKALKPALFLSDCERARSMRLHTQRRSGSSFPWQSLALDTWQSSQ